MTDIIVQARPVKPCRNCLYSPDREEGIGTSCRVRCADFIDWAHDHQRWRRQQQAALLALDPQPAQGQEER